VFVYAALCTALNGVYAGDYCKRWAETIVKETMFAGRDDRRLACTMGGLAAIQLGSFFVLLRVTALNDRKSHTFYIWL
jgi:phage gp37-like protein